MNIKNGEEPLKIFYDNSQVSKKKRHRSLYLLYQILSIHNQFLSNILDMYSSYDPSFVHDSFTEEMILTKDYVPPV